MARAHELASENGIRMDALSALVSDDRSLLVKAALDMRKKAVQYPEGSSDRERLLKEVKNYASQARNLYHK